MNNLPIEIENEIWRLYWMNIYREKCINVLKNNGNNLLKIDIFLKKHFYPSISDSYLMQIKYYLIKYNNFFKEIEENKGLILYLQKVINGKLNFYTSSFLKNTYVKVSDDLIYILLYSICNGVPYMGYQSIDKLSKISFS